jgi:hypothetical protein
MQPIFPVARVRICRAEMQPEQSGRAGQQGKAYSLPAVEHDHIACVELHSVLPRNQVKAKSKSAWRLPKAKRIDADFACFPCVKGTETGHG